MQLLVRLGRGALSLGCLALAILAIGRGLRLLFAGNPAAGSGLGGMGSSVVYFVVGVVALWAAMELFPKPRA